MNSMTDFDREFCGNMFSFSWCNNAETTDITPPNEANRLLDTLRINANQIYTVLSHKSVEKLFRIRIRCFEVGIHKRIVCKLCIAYSIFFTFKFNLSITDWKKNLLTNGNRQHQTVIETGQHGICMSPFCSFSNERNLVSF